MKKVSNLDELVELIGMETVEKCFTEYMMLTIAKARKWDESQGIIGGKQIDSDLNEDNE